MDEISGSGPERKRDACKLPRSTPLPLFEVGEGVVHKKGGLYRIMKTPDGRLLEYCNEPFYEYRRIRDGTIWVRRQSEMEDGRFAKA